MNENEDSRNEIEDKKKSLRRWLAAIEMAKIPPAERMCRKEEFQSMIPVGGRGMADHVFGKNSNSPTAWALGWAKEWIFVIDGENGVGTDTPSQVRRRVGLSILQNGITHICQHHDFYPPYGRYIDYRAMVNSLVNRETSYATVDRLAEEHILLISEIFPDKGLNEVVRSMLLFRLDDLLRRRRDEGLVTILSFARPCSSVMQENLLGDEIQSILVKCHGHDIGPIPEYKIVRLVAGTRGGLV